MSGASVAGAVALTLVGAALGRPAEVMVEVRAAGGAAVSCTLLAAEGAAARGVLTERRPGLWAWHPAPGQALTCSSPGLEPIEIDEASLANRREIRLELPASRMVTLEGLPDAVAAIVEWRAFGEGSTGFVARRRAGSLRPLTLPVASAATRVIRLRTPGMSPFSLLVLPGTTPVTERLPSLHPGGEVLGMLPAHAFRPETLLLTRERRTRATIRPTASRSFQVSGLPPGSYSLVPRYRGGLLGRPRQLVVRAGETTELLPLPLPETGAVAVRAGPEICDADRLPMRIALRRVTDEGRVVEARAVFEQRIEERSCDRDWEGLAEGTYQVSLARAGESGELLSSARFAVRKGTRAQVRLSTLPVRVSGRVTYGDDRPAGDLIVWFELDAQTWSASTDAGGAYTLGLGPPGAYVVSVRATAGLPSHTVVRSLRSGEQRVDLALGGGSLDVRVIQPPGPPSKEAVQLTLTAGSGARLTGTLSPEDDSPARFVGLPFDEYSVTARAPGLTSQDVARVELTPESPAADVDVVLGRHRARLRLTGENGAPLAQGQVTAGGTILAAFGPGEFSLDDVPVGEWLHVRAAGHAPLCHVLEPRDLPELKIALWPAPHALRLHVAAYLPWESGRLLGLPGSDCPVPMAEIGTVTSLGENRTTVLLRMPRGAYQLAIGPARYPLLVPDQDVIIR